VGPDRKQTILNKIKNALKFQGVLITVLNLYYPKYLNERSTNKKKQTDLLSDNHYILNKVTFDYQKNDDSWITQKREVYDRGNGSAILLYNTKQKTVILTRQFRLPTYLNGNKTGMMIEVCAGMLDQDNAEQCVIRETEEETGYRLTTVHKIMETYMSPGAVKFYTYSLVNMTNP
jgi:nudix-type nucleoside diphosphatase (YffH/AdpP family)